MLTFVICTYNRADLLPKLLLSLAEQNLPDSIETEILFVDNNSQDETSAYLKANLSALPMPARVVHEPKQGLSHARNRGWMEAGGDYVGYLDDDARPLPTWIAAYATALAHWRPEGAGGPVLPHSEARCPVWLNLQSPDFAEYVGHLDITKETRWLTPNEGVFGGNMVFRREVLEQVGGFDPRLGVNGKRRFGGEETALQTRVRESGGQILYIPEAAVHHLISARHRSLRYYLRHTYERGMSVAQIEGAKPLRWTTRQAISHSIRSLAALLRGNMACAAADLGRSSGYLGQIHSSRILVREAGRQQ